ncbi:MAG: formate C-acetyltransferase/glycerol dehydratase family glycyl radical enzyme, partial [Clostridia bacterium]|nr:formate C-acetyltransferase/glycerol dehydratase family glycyl radical enzyme [Clostridia bacterium]
NPHAAKFGERTPATPDGRYNGEAFMTGLGQINGKDREGLTALLSSVAGIQPSGIMCGPYLLNVRLDEKLVKNDDYFEKTVDEIETYFRKGGMHIQLNYVSAEELIKAQATPEEYGSLKVRVSGWSGVFVTLDPKLQDDVIRRTVVESH